MGLLEVLTIIFVVLKLTGVINWNWFLVLLPELIAIGLYVVWISLATAIFHKAKKKIEKEWIDFDA